MPLEFLRKESETVNKNIREAGEAITTLNRKKEEAENVLAEYESKGSVAKFFYSKSAVEQAKESIKVADYGISQKMTLPKILKLLFFQNVSLKMKFLNVMITLTIFFYSYF